MSATQSDEIAGLLRRCREGDDEAYMTIYRTLSPKLYGTALRMLRAPDEAEDVLQEAFIRLIKNIDAVDERGAGGWMHRVTVNLCLDRLRRRKRWQETELVELPGGHPGQARASRMDLERAIDRLPERARAIFLMHDVEGYLHREIADVLGISVGATKTQLFRARRRLRGWLGLEAAATT